MYESHQHPALQTNLVWSNGGVDFSKVKNQSYDSEDFTQLYENFEAGINQQQSMARLK